MWPGVDSRSSAINRHLPVDLLGEYRSSSTASRPAAEATMFSGFLKEAASLASEVESASWLAMSGVEDAHVISDM